MVVGIPQVHSAVDFFPYLILIFSVVDKYLNFATFSKDVLLVFIYCHFVQHFANSCDRNVYIDISVFISRPVSLQGTNKADGLYTLTL